jgi:hypothetical protein
VFFTLAFDESHKEVIQGFIMPQLASLRD